MRRAAVAVGFVLVLAAADGRAQPARDEETTTNPEELATEAAPAEEADGDEVLAFIDHRNFDIVVKNVTQTDQSGDSQFGIGVDWNYAFGADFELLLPSTVMLSGSGMTSLGDPNTSPAEAPEASNFNSITNQLRYSANHLFEPERRQFSTPPPVGDPVALAKWKEEAKAFAREEEERIAEGYTAIDLGAQAQTESSQTFQSTQVALGGSVTVASALGTNLLLYPLKYLVPDRKEHGDVIRPILLFAAIEEVLGANQRETLDGGSSDDFERFRFEIAWQTELLVRGLYPFVDYHLYRDLSADAALTAAGKKTAQWLEVGANYYVADRIETLRDLLDVPEGRGPFVTLRYATGELPPYLESDDQASVGLGFDF